MRSDQGTSFPIDQIRCGGSPDAAGHQSGAVSPKPIGRCFEDVRDSRDDCAHHLKVSQEIADGPPPLEISAMVRGQMHPRTFPSRAQVQSTARSKPLKFGGKCCARQAAVLASASVNLCRGTTTHDPPRTLLSRAHSQIQRACANLLWATIQKTAIQHKGNACAISMPATLVTS